MTQHGEGPYVFISSTRRQLKVYHRTGECPALKDGQRRIPKTALNGHGRKCKMCYHPDKIDTGGSESVACPKCGESFNSLGLHLPHCDGGGGDD